MSTNFSSTSFVITELQNSILFCGELNKSESNSSSSNEFSKPRIALLWGVGFRKHVWKMLLTHSCRRDELVPPNMRDSSCEPYILRCWKAGNSFSMIVCSSCVMSEVWKYPASTRWEICWNGRGQEICNQEKGILQLIAHIDIQYNGTISPHLKCTLARINVKSTAEKGCGTYQEYTPDMCCGQPWKWHMF